MQYEPQMSFCFLVGTLNKHKETDEMNFNNVLFNSLYLKYVLKNIINKLLM